MYASYASRRERTASALGAGALVLAIVSSLVFGLQVSQGLRTPAVLTSVVFAPPEPPKPKQPERQPRPAASSAPKQAAGARNLRNRAAQVVAPPVVSLVPPPPLPTATQAAGIGSAAQTGASDRLGPGQGAGGIGNGLGGGGNGGDGDGGRAAVGPRQVRGKLSYRDMPRDVLAPGGEARVGVRYWVETDGRIRECRIDESSGYPGIDAMTCRLIEQRFVYRPARNRAGDPVRVPVVEWHTWFSREEGD